MAVYTRLGEHEIQQFLAQYDVGELVSFKGITEGIENTNYLLVTSLRRTMQRYILTLFEHRVAAADLPYFLGLTEWLYARGIGCPRAVKGRDGKNIRPLAERPAALIEFLEGRGSPHITPLHMHLVGALMARLHLAAKDFPLVRANAMALPGWREIFARFRDQADTIAPGLECEMAQELDYLEKHWPTGLPSGPIHADIFPDNIFFIDGNTDQPELTGIIDFYFACNDFWMYDLAICMNAWCFDTGHRLVPERARALFETYNRARPITPQERRALPVLARGAAMRFLVTRAHDWLHRPDGALVNPKDPMEYVAKLRFHRENGMNGLLDDWMTR